MIATIDTDRFDGDGTWVAFDYRDGFGRARSGFVVRYDGRFHAFRNLCPHWSTPLDADGDDLFDTATGEIVCQTHGARFDAESGECVAGPCRGQSLERLSAEVDGDRVVVKRSGLDL